MKLFLFLTTLIMFFGIIAKADIVSQSGDDALISLKNINIFGKVKIISTQDVPTVSPGIVAPLGSIAMNYLTGQTYVKTGAGNTAWTASGDIASHLKAKGSAPVATVNANAGTGGACTVSHASDVAGTVNLTTTAVSPSAGAQCSLAFAAAYTTAPVCVIGPADADSANDSVLQGIYVTSSTSAMVINFATAEITGAVYNINYHCTETN